MGSKNNNGRKTLALLAATATSAGGLTAGTAYAGGGGDQGGTGGGGSAAQFWSYKDDASGSWGSATDLNSVSRAMAAVGVRMDDSAGKAAKALSDANAECVAGFHQRHPGEGDGDCRVVAVGAASGNGSTTGVWNGSGVYAESVWKSNWYKYVAPNKYNYAGTREYLTSNPFDDDPSNSVDKIMESHVDSTRSIVVIVLDKYQPAPPDYTLSVATKASGTTTKAGDTGNVADTITTSRNGSGIDENVSGTSTLRWIGVDGTARTASKQFTMNNNASQNVSFSYRDMDASWKSWPAGKFTFDVSFAKQGRMAGAVSLNGDADANERWQALQLPAPKKTLTNAAGDQVAAPNDQIASGSLYTAHIKAHSSASEHFWLYDTIDASSQKVLIGGTDGDDVSKVTVTDEDGRTVRADISIDDGQAGKRIVKAHVLKPAAGWYTLNVPQSAKPTGADYTIPDDSKACWQGDGQDCQAGDSKQVGKVTPKPDKVWVLDSNGALNAEDPEHTNDKGSDDRTFVTGDAIGAVVNGRLPGHLLNPFASYSITDDWTASAQWIDWNHKDQVRVYVDGKDVTDQFDIAIDTAKHTTTATAKSGFLAKTALGANDRRVKLYIGGIVSKAPSADYASDQHRLTNKASETWNNETADTNEPPVYVRNPKPDKVWNTDVSKAGQSADPAWTNTVSDDTKTFVQRDTFAVTVNGKLPRNLAKKLSAYELGDDFTKASKYVDLDKASVKVTIDGKNSTGQFDIHKEGTKVWVSAKQTLLDTTANTPADRAVRMTVEGAYKKGVLQAGQKVDMTNGGWEKWNDQEIPSNEPPVKEWSPNPDKSWIRLENGKWKAVIDPDETNKTGADTMKFLDGDQVGSVVNGTIANDLAKVTAISLTDDYRNADYLFDLTRDKSQIRVYEADATTDAKSSIADIITTGRDVTDRFDITVNGTKVTATAHADYLAEQVGLKNPKQITLFLPGTVNMANGKGAAQVRKDFNKAAGDELTFCTDPTTKKDLTNAGGETVNNESQPTNEPKICGYIPPVKKKVIAEGSQGGANQDANDKVVYPGQRVEYRLTTKPQLPADLAYDITTVRDVDTYDRYLEPDPQTLEVTDLSTGDQLAMSDPQMGVEGEYSVAWDESNHRFTITYSDKYVKEHWKKGSNPQVQVRFEGTVSKDAPTDRNVDNQWALTLNNGITPSNIVENKPPKHETGKKDTQSSTQGDPTVTIDGKTMLLGDTGNYTVKLDLKQKDNAYRVWRAGITDDYDDKYVSIDPGKIEVLDANGRDVTAKFNVQIKNGVAYVYARTVDTFVPKTGKTVKGDPQPGDLAAYSTKDDHDPLAEPAIDQTLLGQEYQIVMPYKVVKVTDGYVVRNKAIQVTNNTTVETNEVSNPLKPINPVKDVTVRVGGSSVNGRSIYKDRTFLYRLDSSMIPANRAYPQVDQWAITDHLDTEHDEYTGRWAVYAARDLYKDGTVVAKAGDKLAGDGFDSKKFGGDLFALDYKDGTVTVTATDVYRALVSADNAHENGWTAYIPCRRTAIAERVENRFTEQYNDKTMESNVVWTRTPDMTPGLHLEKYDVKSGEQLGDRDDVKDALKMDGDSLEIAFKITNTSKTDNGDGAWFQAKDLKLTDDTIAGIGKVEDLKYPDDWDALVLKPGESVTVTGTLKGVSEDGKHTDRAKVTGTPLVECPVTDQFGDGDKSDQTVDGDADTTDGLKRVTVGGKTLCEDNAVESNTDDWSGYRPSLARTGLEVGGAMLAVIALACIGMTLAGFGRRQPTRGRHTA